MNHGQDAPAYGLWPLVFINSAVFILFAFSFFKPKTKHDWRTFGEFSGFIIALFGETYGFPLTIYLLAGWLTPRLPGANLLLYDMGHPYELLGFKGDQHGNPFHLASYLFIVAGFLLLTASWKVFFAAKKGKKLATAGPYSYVRHPQYVAFMAIMLGFLLQWPTLTTLIMFLTLVAAYVRLSHREEGEVVTEFGQAWMNYARSTPRWFPSRCLPTLRRDGSVIHFWGR